MAIDFDGTGDVLDADVETNWMRNLTKGSILAFVDWDVPASQVDSVLKVDRGAGGAGARLELDLTSFAPAPSRARTRRLDADAEYVAVGAGAAGSPYQSFTTTCDWTAQLVRLYVGAVEDASSPFTASWASGSTSNTDPQASTIGAALNGIIHALYSWHRVLTLAEIQCIHQSEGASMVYDDLQSMHLMMEGAPGAAVSGAGSVKDISNLNRHASPSGNPAYAESRTRRRRLG